MDFFVKASVIKTWASASGKTAQVTMPHLLRRLVSSTATGITQLDFPAYESTQRSGFDGTVECNEGNAWVPTGRSVWETGTSVSPKRKADEDLQKRSHIDNTPRAVQEQTTFVFVSPRHCEDKAQWVADNKTTGHWKDIRFLDADDLEHWAESAPYGIRVWMGQTLGSRPAGIEDVEARWKSIQDSVECQLTPSVFLAGRTASVERIQEWLNGVATHLPVYCRSPIEIIDFYCAYVATLEENDQAREQSRAVIVQTRESWEFIRQSTSASVVLLAPDLSVSQEEIMSAVANSHHVLTAGQMESFGSNIGMELERARQFELMQSLEESGLTPAVAEREARATGGSLAILKHRLQQITQRPAWLEVADADVATACLLLGGWTEKEADKRVFERVSGRDYASCETVLKRWATCQDSLLFHAAGKWRLVSKDFAWPLLQGLLSSTAIQRFEEVAFEILADDDPRYSLPESQRWTANIHGHVAQYSGTMKKHVSETLAYLGQFGDKISADTSVDIESTVNRIVASVLAPTATWHRWASLSGLNLLAEASPDVFLRAVFEDLALAEPELGKLLHEEEDPLFGSCNHSGLLWALETVAWSKRHFPRVMESLLELSAIDPGGRWSNRPKNCLREILSNWMPQTTATVGERIQLLDLLITKNREASWQMLLDLLSGSTISHPTHKPYWRDWANEWNRGTTHAESLQFVTAVAERLVAQAGSNAVRWKVLFEHLGDFPYTVRDQFLAAALQFSKEDLPDTLRRELHHILTDKIDLHRRFSESDWSIPPETLAALDVVAVNLTPQNPVLRNAWLFEHYPDKFSDSDSSVDESQSNLTECRRRAVSEILNSAGYQGVESLVSLAESPWTVGYTLAQETEDKYVDNLIPAYLGDEVLFRDFAAGFVHCRSWPDNWHWVDLISSKCVTPNSKASFYATLPFGPKLWARVKKSGHAVWLLYWDRCVARNSELNAGEVTVAAQCLIEQQRPLAAIDLVRMALDKDRDLPTEILLKTLESFLDSPAEENSNRSHSRHSIKKIINELQQKSDADVARMIRIEWNFLRLLDRQFGDRPVAIYRTLSENPSFFVEVLGYCYRPRGERGKEDAAKADPSKQKIAAQAFQLLNDWDELPRENTLEVVNPEALQSWCESAVSLASESDRREVCENHIGQLFGRILYDWIQGSEVPSDGECVLVVSETIDSDSFRSGMNRGLSNSRGSVWRESGGDQERELVDKYRSKADEIRFTSPVVADVLDSVAESYEREAKWWDERDRWEQ